MSMNEIIASRLEAVKQKMSEENLDALFISQPENRRYLSGYKATDDILIESVGQLFITADTNYLFTDFRYGEEAEEQAPLYKVQVYTGGPAEFLKTITADLKLKRIGFESDYMIHSVYNTFSESVKPAEFIPTTGFIGQIRKIKDNYEISMIEQALTTIEDIMEIVFERLKQSISTGITERQVAWWISEELDKRGSKPSFNTIVAAAENGSRPHSVPTDKVIKPNQPIVIDTGAMIEGYCSDITRTAYFGEPDAKFKEIYSVVKKAQLAALENARTGMKADEIDAFARKIITDAGYGKEFGHGLGHGVGLAIHEAPSISPSSSKVTEEGMITTVEPGIYIPGWGGVRLEVMARFDDKKLVQLGRRDCFYDF